MDQRLLERACQLYLTSPDQLTPLSGGHFNAVYQYACGEKLAILRIGVEDYPSEQTLSMLDFMRYLSQENAPVARPLLSANGMFLESLEFKGKRYNITACEKAAGTLAEDIPPSRWTDDLFCSIGKAVGKLHRISAEFRPSVSGFIRPHWFESSEIHDAIGLLSTSSDPAREKLAILVQGLRSLPTDPGDYGLIHDDLHFANFLVRADDSVTVFDFDDCEYGWFAMDVAMALFDVLVLYNAGNETESQFFAHRFMHAYLAGYLQERDLSTYWLSQIPNFLKLKELCIYATLIGHPDVNLPDTWVGRFMRNRAERIARDIPYVDIDFSTLRDLY